MSILVSPDVLLARRGEAGGDVPALRENLGREVDAVLARPLHVPEAKALLSRWGAQCRDDGAPLGFDPFSPDAQKCTRCGRVWSTEQSQRWWVYWYQEWLAERTWLLALFSGNGGRADAEARAVETLAVLAASYERWPNADNVLGPSRPFFSTYLESIWVLHLAAAASLLESLGSLPADVARELRERLFRPSAGVIADFDEGRSNRQVWNAVALFALGRVLGDDRLRDEAAHGKSGILALVENGLAEDGLWYEGENYHWFALRGLAWGAELLREAGIADLWEDAGPHGSRFRAAFEAPIATVLPDFTMPARRDSRFGVSLRQRRFVELWELALARGAGDPLRIGALLSHVYAGGQRDGGTTLDQITEVERWGESGGVRRDGLGWKGLLWMEPTLRQAPPDAWEPDSVLLEATGVAVFRGNERRTYVSLDYGEPGGGHGHPDRLNVTLVRDGVPWLLDFGTGSYVSPSLGWYRMTLAHNAPMLDGVSQADARGTLIAHDDQGEYGWVCAMLGEGTAFEGAAIQRTLVVAPGYLLDVVQMSGDGEHTLQVPWHGLGRMELDDGGVTFTREDGAVLSVRLSARQPFQVRIQRAPGPALGLEAAEELDFPVIASAGEQATLVACLDLGAGLDEVECVDDDFLVRFDDGGVHVHRATDDGWTIELERGDPVMLGGLRPMEDAPPASPAEPSLGERLAVPGGRFTIGGAGAQAAPVDAPAAARCMAVASPPALDGSLDGYDVSAPLTLDSAEQFRRAEEEWEGPESFSASAWLNHDDTTLFVAVDVVAAEPWFRPPEGGDPEWENENPDIHGDGVQVYVETTGFYGWLVVPDAHDRSRLRVSAVRGSDAFPEMVTEGAWAPTENGYRLTFAVELADAPSGAFGFDLCVNRGREGRERRIGQLVWSGSRGSRLYLAGDRPLPGPLPRVSVE